MHIAKNFRNEQELLVSNKTQPLQVLINQITMYNFVNNTSAVNYHKIKLPADNVNGL